MSHKGLVAVIILVSVVTIGVYASTILPTESPYSEQFINSIQQDITIETVQTTDEVLLSRDLRVVINDSMSSTTIP